MNWSSLNAFWEWLSLEWETIVPAPALNFPSEPLNGQVFGRFAWYDGLPEGYPSFEQYNDVTNPEYTFDNFNSEYDDIDFELFTLVIRRDVQEASGFIPSKQVWDFA